jgi:Immunity protein 74
VIIEVTRGHLKFGFQNKLATVQGEMFFPENGKMGFVVYSDTIKKWDSPSDSVEISAEERIEILQMLKREFASGGNILEIE